MAFTAADIGPLYDLGLATRDGTALQCKNKDGKPITISSLAYMTSATPQQRQLEETELAHKDRLVQLSSPNVIDREFDQWPQATQGDWSGGELQRVFSGPQADPSRYWRGHGVLWPINDYLPQEGARPAAVVKANQSGVVANPGPVGGDLTAFVASGFGTGWAYWAHDQTSNAVTVTVRSGDNQNTTPDNPFGVAVQPDDMVIGGGHLFVVTHDVTGVHLWGDFGTINFVAIDTPTANAPSTGLAVAAALVGNKIYVAVAYIDNSPGNANAHIKLYDLSFRTNTNDYVINGSQVLNFSYPGTPQALCFQGDNLIITMSAAQPLPWTPQAGASSTILSYNIPAATFTTIATITGSCYLTPVASGLFVVSVEVTGGVVGGSTANQIETVDLYLLQGSSLQHIGPLTQPLYYAGVSRPVSFGPYALFSTCTSSAAGSGQLVVWAYDVLRGRLFRAWVSAPAYVGSFFCIMSMAVISSVTRTRSGGAQQFLAQWGVAVAGYSAVSTVTFQEIYFGISPGTGSIVPIQQPVDLTSSMIDFTAPTLSKLFRQVVISFLPLDFDPSASVTLNVWLDQDPATLAAVPDFTTAVVGSVPNQGLSQLSLPINKMARKLVYQVITTGGGWGAASGAWVYAPKLLSVAVQAATGWVQTLHLDLSPNSKVNSANQSDYCFQKQGFDHVAAYNFLKQLWRQKGGQVTATFPNGDTGNWLLQDIQFESPKPFAVAFRSDQQSTYQTLAMLKLREDI